METIVNQVWDKSKLLVKGLLIGGLILLLIIPTVYVQNLVEERQERQKEAFMEVSSKWAGAQTITAPVLVIPYKEQTIDSTRQPVVLKRYAYFLPDKLQYTTTLNPQKKYRGIYEVMLYTTGIHIAGSFKQLPLQSLKLTNEMMLWDEAYMAMDITDARGLKEDLSVHWNDTDLSLEPATINNGIFKEAFMAPVHINENTADSTILFSADLKVNGSEKLLFNPVGKETIVKMQSTWQDPSFSGVQLPETSSIEKEGFTATWKSFSHKRNFPQAWKDASYDIANSSFGVDLFIPVNAYQKTLRSVKYAILCILLTFAAFFLIETVHQKSVHPFQYALIGMALILFYTLLLSFSEYTGFNTAYAIASIATVSLISWFVKGLLRSGKLSSLLAFVLVLTYGYIFTLLQLQDYALLLGSIGLFITLAIIMHFSKKIAW